MTPDEEWEHLSRQLDQLGDELREFSARSERSADELRAFNRHYLLRMDRIHLRPNQEIALMRADLREAAAVAGPARGVVRHPRQARRPRRRGRLTS